MSYILNTEAMRIVEKNEKGTVTYRKRYRKGDKVDVSYMDEARVQTLLEKGTLVRSEDDLSEAVEAGSLQPHSGPFGAALVDPTGQSETVEPDAEEQGEEQEQAEQTGDPDSGSVAANTLTPANPESQVEPPAPTGDGEDEVEDVDRYSDMDYPSLQEEAKNRDLRYVGVSADDLRASLREADNS